MGSRRRRPRDGPTATARPQGAQGLPGSALLSLDASAGCSPLPVAFEAAVAAEPRSQKFRASRSACVRRSPRGAEQTRVTSPEHRGVARERLRAALDTSSTRRTSTTRGLGRHGGDRIHNGAPATMRSAAPWPEHQVRTGAHLRAARSLPAPLGALPATSRRGRAHLLGSGTSHARSHGPPRRAPTRVNVDMPLVLFPMAEGSGVQGPENSTLDSSHARAAAHAAVDTHALCPGPYAGADRSSCTQRPVSRSSAKGILPSCFSPGMRSHSDPAPGRRPRLLPREDFSRSTTARSGDLSLPMDARAADRPLHARQRRALGLRIAGAPRRPPLEPATSSGCGDLAPPDPPQRVVSLSFSFLVFR